MTDNSTFGTRVSMGTISRGTGGSDTMEQHSDSRRLSIMVSRLLGRCIVHCTSCKWNFLGSAKPEEVGHDLLSTFVKNCIEVFVHAQLHGD